MKDKVCYGISMLIALATTMLLPVRAGDGYSFIIAGYPAKNDSHSLATAGTALVTSSRTTSSLAVSLEARYRTIQPTVPTALRSDKRRGMVISIY